MIAIALKAVHSHISRSGALAAGVLIFSPPTHLQFVCTWAHNKNGIVHKTSTSTVYFVTTCKKDVKNIMKANIL